MIFSADIEIDSATRERERYKKNTGIIDHKCASRFQECVTMKMDMERGEYFEKTLMKNNRRKKNDDNFESFGLL